jgi:Zn-dependent protease with chaperone function
MILPYLVRLGILSLACFFLVHAALAIGMNFLAPRLLALAKRRKPNSAAGLLLAARLFPPVAAVLVVAGICVPSYLWLEPEAAVEQVGFGCLAAALFGVASWSISAGRGLRAIRLSMRYERYCREVGREMRLGAENSSVSVVDEAAGLFALAGILHPRLVISREVFQSLSEEELAAALRHERAHATSHDNLKRLLLLLAPNKHFAGLESLERGWAQFTEWSADDSAVAGDPLRAVSLAGALVRVARLGASVEASPLMTSLVADGRDLEARVDRLLRGALPNGQNLGHGGPRMLAALVLAAGIFGAVMSGPATLQAAHRLLEQLIR